MTANPTAAPQDAHNAPQGVSVDVQDVIDRYSAELAQVTSRAIIAEAGMAGLQRRVQELEAAQAPEPVAPSTDQEG